MTPNTLALITGASSGFGVDFARACAKRGYGLVLVARREEKLREVAATLRTQYPGLGVEVVVADLALDGERERLAAYVAGLVQPLEVLINNAGLGLYGRFETIPWAKERQMLDIDIAAVVHLTKLFLPGMRARRSGYVLNVASIGAYQPTPLYASYSAAKAFVLSFSEALNFEMRGSGVSVTVVSPGVAATEFLSVSKQEQTLYQRMMMMRSDQVVEAAVDALFKRRSSVVPGVLNSLAAVSAKMMPGALAARVANAVMKSNEPIH